MDANTASQQMFDLWKRQIEETTRTWAEMMAAVPAPGGTDPMTFWRPVMDQGVAAWSRIMGLGPVSPDLMGQWKQFLDQWIEAWSKALSQAMGTETFARALGQYLDQWLVAQGPVKKAAEQTMETMLQTFGMPSRAQVTAVARQLVELEERLERLEDSVRAVLKRLDAR